MGQRGIHPEAASKINGSKRAILDTSLSVALPTTRVRAPGIDNWEKISHLMDYLNGDQDQSLLPSGKNDQMLMR